MHAGDALWFIHAGLAYMEEKHGKTPALDHLRECARTIGTYLKVPVPNDRLRNDLVKQLRELDATLPDSSSSDSPGTGNTFGDIARIDAAKTLLDQMESSDLFGWADMVTSIHAQVQKDSPFITDKQFRGLVNVARKGVFEDGPNFWDNFEDEYPDAAKSVLDYAAQA
jgi:hypothetical protein